MMTQILTLVRLMAQRDRVRSVVWIGLLSLFIVATAVGMKDLFPDAEARRTFAMLAESNPSQLGMLGHVYSDSIGGLVAWRVSAFAIFVGLFGIFTMTRHSQALEEGGQLELVLSQPVHRLLPWRMAVVWSLCNVLMLALAFAAVLVWQGFVWSSAVLFGASFLLDGWVMVALTAVLSHISQRARLVNAVTAIVMVVGYMGNVSANLGNESLRWWSPIVWIQRTQPFAAEAWWPIGVGLVLVAVLLALADLVARRREYGVGLIAPRAGVGHAQPRLLHLWGFWWLAQRNLTLAWWLAVSALAFVVAGLGQTMAQQTQGSEQLTAIMQMLGDTQNMTRAYVAFMHLVIAFAAAAAGVQVIALLRHHEHSGLLDPLLAGVRSRTEVLVVTGLGALLASGGVMVSYALVAGYAHTQIMAEPIMDVRASLAAMAVYFPAVLSMLAVAWVLYAGVPRLFAVIWLWFVANIAVTWFADLLHFPATLTRLVPFFEVPSLLANQTVAYTDVVGVLVVSIGLMGCAWWLWLRRDVGSP
jgi:ABC-2 type transport system permease protein